MASLNISTRSLLAVAIPMSLGAFVQFIVSFTDTLFLAQLHGNAMSGAAFIGLVYITLAMIGYGLGNATQILVARRNGENKIREAGRITANSLTIGLLVSVVQFTILFFIVPRLLDVFIEHTETRQYMNEFLTYRSFGFFFYTTTLILHSFWSGIAQTRVMIYTTLITASVNIVLDYGLIFGNLGMPQWGTAGAAIATAISEACAVVFLIGYTYRHAAAQPFQIAQQFFSTRIEALDTELLPTASHRSSLLEDGKTIFTLGLPIILQLVLSLFIWVVFYNFVEKLGPESFQSSFIVRNMYSLVWVSVMGFSTTTKTYVSGLIAEGRQADLKATVLKLVLLNCCGVLFMTHGLWAYPDWIVGQFTQDPLVAELTQKSIAVVLPAMLIFACTSILLAAVEGSGNTMAGFVIEIITSVCYIIAAYLLASVWHQPVYVVWMSDYLYFLLLGLLSLWFMWSGKWKYKNI